jgi:hypothetical protein
MSAYKPTPEQQALGLIHESPDEAQGSAGSEGPKTSGGLGLSAALPVIPAEDVDDYLETGELP